MLSQDGMIGTDTDWRAERKPSSTCDTIQLQNFVMFSSKNNFFTFRG